MTDLTSITVGCRMWTFPGEGVGVGVCEGLTGGDVTVVQTELET